MFLKRTSTSKIDFAETAVIAISTTTSGVIDTVGTSLVGIITPAALTGTQFTFVTSDVIGGTFVPVYNDSGAKLTVTVPTAEARAILWNSTDLEALRFLKLVSNQTEIAERTIKLLLRVK